MTTWTIEETFRLIELYRNEASIWNPKDKYHKDKNKVNDSCSGIKKEKGIPHDFISDSFKEKKNSIRSGAGVDDIYKPIWIYYDAMEVFLKDIYECKSILNTEEEVVYVDNIQEAPDGCSPSQEESTSTEVTTQKESPAAVKLTLPTRKRRSFNPPELQDINGKMNTAFTTLNEVLNKKNKDCDDECALYGRLLGVKLKDFSLIHRSELMYEIDGLILDKRQELYRNSTDPNSSIASPRSSVPSPYSSVLSPQTSIPYSYSHIASPRRNIHSQHANQISDYSVSNHNEQTSDLETETFIISDCNFNRQSHNILSAACDSAELSDELYDET